MFENASYEFLTNERTAMNLIYETDRLILKVLASEQADMVLDFYERNRDFLEPKEPERPSLFYTREYQATTLRYELNAFAKFEYARYWIMKKGESDRVIGSICFNEFRKGGTYADCQIGYKLDEGECRKGYMYEAMSFLVPMALREYHLKRIEALVMPENKPSINLLKKLGFIKEGYLHDAAQINGEWKDHELYTFLQGGISK